MPAVCPPQLEFAVQMTCESCAEKVRAALEGKPGEEEQVFVINDLREAADSVCVYVIRPTNTYYLLSVMSCYFCVSKSSIQFCSDCFLISNFSSWSSVCISLFTQ